MNAEPSRGTALLQRPEGGCVDPQGGRRSKNRGRDKNVSFTEVTRIK
jgi:hypothetical protein